MLLAPYIITVVECFEERIILGSLHLKCLTALIQFNNCVWCRRFYQFSFLGTNGIFDFMGLACPFTIRFKLLMRQLFEGHTMRWEDTIPDVRHWIQQLLAEGSFFPLSQERSLANNQRFREL